MSGPTDYLARVPVPTFAEEYARALQKMRKRGEDTGADGGFYVPPDAFTYKPPQTRLARLWYRLRRLASLRIRVVVE